MISFVKIMISLFKQTAIMKLHRKLLIEYTESSPMNIMAYIWNLGYSDMWKI